MGDTCFFLFLILPAFIQKQQNTGECCQNRDKEQEPIQHPIGFKILCDTNHFIFFKLCHIQSSVSALTILNKCSKYNRLIRNAPPVLVYIFILHEIRGM